MVQERVNILGVEVSRYNLDETMTRMSEAIRNRDKIQVAVTPVNCILWAREDPGLMEIYNRSAITTADGVPLVWASRLLGEPIRGRVTGLDLLPEFSKISSDFGFTFFFLGAAEGVADQLSEKLKQSYPDLKIAGTYSPPYAEKFSEDENERIINRINESGADVLWVSLTAPKQDYWIAEHLEKLNISVAIGVGAAFDVVSGNISRAPKWMQHYGLEWFYRLLQEPKRLFSRYLIEAPKFIPLVIIQKLKSIKISS
ncbi:MAG: glycosyltransferase [Balneolaceae bacterium]|nr:MAG: glycosyltransferase [Balneolaceae bacterium]